MAYATDGCEFGRTVAIRDAEMYRLRVDAVMEAVTNEFGQCTSEQAERILANAGYAPPTSVS